MPHTGTPWALAFFSFFKHVSVPPGSSISAAPFSDIQDHRRYDSDKLRAFFVQEGQAVETWSTTLHFTPIMARESGFRAAIVLPSETNAPLPAVDPGQPGEAGLLWAVNKWLVACPDSVPASKGAVVGISRDIEVVL